MDHRPRDPHVVAGGDRQPAAHRLELCRALHDVPELVAVAVREVDVVRLRSAREVDGEVAVEEERDAALERHARCVHLARIEETALEGLATVRIRGGDGVAARRLGDLDGRRRRVPMIEIRERAAEPAAREHLLVEEVALGVPEDGVRLGGHEPAAHAIDHAPAPLPVFWNRSMLSKRARKFP
jgi:hypothetical protein